MGRKGLEEGEKDLVEKPGKTFEFNLDLPEDFVAENTCQCFFICFFSLIINQFLYNQLQTLVFLFSMGIFSKMILNKYHCGGYKFHYSYLCCSMIYPHINHLTRTLVLM